MFVQDVINSVKTRLQERNQKDIKKVDVYEYFIKKHWRTVKKIIWNRDWNNIRINFLLKK